MIGFSRDYDLSRANYQSLLDRNLANQTATEIEKREKPERFTILESARVPERPLKPNRGLLDALGTMVALFLGVGIGLGSEIRRGVILGEWEIPKERRHLGPCSDDSRQAL